ncbi:histidine phosphatase family protein [Chryseomicrobium sp. FSL W7-1435]|uniref:histidine phosphatase family protein n=1 Tax=Chryseomicrobium sp. FSL W7-1435 TaxID=2921704 RepID=UPI00315A959D
MTSFLLIRHCSATGQEPDAPLTTEGLTQANHLAAALADYPITRILSSPYIRAVDTILAYSKLKKIPIELDDRLKERVLSSTNLPDWLEKLEQTFIDPSLSFEGGESSVGATTRIVEVLNEGEISEGDYCVVVTHGNLAALLLHSISADFGFKGWQSLSNPDVFEITWEKENKNFKRLSL